MTIPHASKPAASNYRWTICALLFAATTINYMDRQILGLLAPIIQKDIGWNELEYSRMNSVFYILYAVGVIGFGRLIDAWGTKLSYAGAMVFWSIAALGHSVARSFGGFAFMRAMLGLGEAGNFPSCIKAITEWFPKQERAHATGIFNSGSNFGAICAPAVIPALGARYGWRTTYVIVGSLGFLWLLAWIPLFNRPSKSKFINAAELSHIESGDTEENQPKVAWWPLLARRQTWAFMLGKFMTDPIWWFYLLWLPKWLNSTRGLDLTHIGMPLVLVYLIATIGSVGGGFLSSVLMKRGASANRARKTAMAIFAASVLPTMLLVTRVENIWVAVSLVGIAAAAHQGWSANLFTTASDMFPKAAIGSVVGLGTMAGSVGMLIFGEVIGRVLQASGNYTFLFTLCAFAYVLAFGLFHLLAPRMEKTAG